jgi:hypothetical protein
MSLKYASALSTEATINPNRKIHHVRNVAFVSNGITFCASNLSANLKIQT